MSFLPVVDIGRASVVSRQWNLDAELVWKGVCLRGGNLQDPQFQQQLITIGYKQWAIKQFVQGHPQQEQKNEKEKGKSKKGNQKDEKKEKEKKEKGKNKARSKGQKKKKDKTS